MTHVTEGMRSQGLICNSKNSAKGPDRMAEPVGPLGTIRAKTRGRMSRINVQGDNRARCPPWMSYYLLISKEFRVEVAGRQTLLNGGNIGPGGRAGL